MSNRPRPWEISCSMPLALLSQSLVLRFAQPLTFCSCDHGEHLARRFAASWLVGGRSSCAHAAVAEWDHCVPRAVASQVLSKEPHLPPTVYGVHGHVVDLASETAVAESCEQENGIARRPRGGKLGRRTKNAAEALSMRSGPQTLTGSC
jgi:hypothetical protein